MNRSLVGHTRRLAVTAMLSAVAFALMFLEFAIPALIPNFVKMDISDLPALIGSFCYGPLCGVAVCFLKNLLHILFKGTSTAFAGEIANFLLGCCLTVPAGLIYRLFKEPKDEESRKRSGRRAALAGCLFGSAAMGILSVPVNYFISYPAYIRFYGLPEEAILSAYQAILPSVDSLVDCLIVFNAPFTLVKGLITSLVTFLIYKRIAVIIKKEK